MVDQCCQEQKAHGEWAGSRRLSPFLQACSLLQQPYWKSLTEPAGEGNGTPLQYSCLENPNPASGWRSLVGCSPWDRWGSDTTERLHFHFSLSCIGEGNGNPLQCSCLENPRDEGAWWAAIYEVAQSRTRLKWRSSSSNRASQQNRNAGCRVLVSASQSREEKGGFEADGL